MIYNICYGIGSSALVALFFFFFCYIKKFTIAQKILSVYVFISAGVISSLLLWLFLPDARHIFFTTIISYIIATAGYIFSLFSDKKVFRYLGRLLFLIVAAVWTSLYYTTFYLFHIPLWVNIVSIIFYVAVLTTVLIILKSKSIAVNFWVIISLTLVSIFNYCGFITMCFSPKVYSIILYTGSLLFLLALIYFIFEYAKKPLKHTEPAKLILLTLSQSFTALAGVLLFIL